MKITRFEYDLSNVDEKYKHIVKVLLDEEDNLSDGYGFYCGMDSVIETLVNIAKKILGEK